MPRSFFNPFPKYLQIRDILRRRIAMELAPGDAFPTEHELSRQFGVSRETVRQALRGIEAEGLIERRPGIGTTVRRRPPRTAETRLTGLVEDFTALGLDTEAKVMFKGPIRPPAEIADALGVAAEDEVYRIERLRRLEGVPLAHHDSWLPAGIGAQVGRRPLQRTAIVHELMRLELDPREEWQKVEAIVADAELARQLETPIGAPLLVITRLFRDRAGRALVFFRSHFRADRYYYTANLAAAEQPKRTAPEGARRSPRRRARPSPRIEERHG